MNKSTIRKEIAALINSIKEHSDNIGDKEQIPQLELELILHKIEKLYQKSIVFNHLNSLPEVPGEINSPVKKQEPVIEKKFAEPVPSETRKEIPKTDSTDLFGGELPPVVEKQKSEKKPDKKEEKKEEKPASRISKPPISDLTKAIGLNDKFQFANDLFEGSMQEYSIAIHQLNTAGSLESAMDYISSLQLLYEWDMEKDAVKRLMDLVDRRYC